MASVEIIKIEKKFGSTHVIRGVDVQIADGEFTVLVDHRLPIERKAEA